MAVAVEGISEVMHHHMTGEEEEPQLVEKLRRRRHHDDEDDKTPPTAGDDNTSSSSSDASRDESSDGETSDSKTIVVNGHNNEEQVLENNGTSSEKSVHYDKNEGSTLKLSLSDKNIRVEDVVNSIINNQDIGNLKDEIVQQKSTQEDVIGTSGGANTNIRIDLLEESDDEVIELEFERSVEKVHTHTPYCPNCNAQITKVILRRRRRETKPEKPVDALGCLSCFSVFVPSGDCLNRIFGWRREPSIFQTPAPALAPPAGGDSANENISTPVTQEDDSFGLCGIFMPKPKKDPQNLQGNNQVPEQKHTTVGSLLHDPLLPGSGQNHPKLGSPLHDTRLPESGQKRPKLSSPLHGPLLPPSKPAGPEKKYEDASGGVANEPNKPGPIGDLMINVGGNEQGSISASHRSTLLEIFKCIVYGGLIESIASLSVVSSAAASDATTLNILAIGLATVFSGLLVFLQNLMDLKNVSGENADRYEEHLGTRGHFLLHSTFAILAFLVFGSIPSVVYGFAFRESDNKDYKILTVAIAAFVCIFVLAIAKAYVQRSQRFSEYIKTISYYLTMAVVGSGVGYAVGDLVKILMEKYGWFEPSDPAAASMILGGPGQASYMM